HVFIFLVASHLFIFLSNPFTISAAESTNKSDIELRALLDFKEAVADPSGVLSAWVVDVHFCRWSGVTCEYGMGYKISTGCDMYSFGVLLLEMVTGKRPTDAMFIDGMSLHKLVSSAYPNGLHEVLDPYMSQEGDRAFASSTLKGYLIPLVEIALLCSMELPKDRPVMQDIYARIFEISEAFHESW
ncbi:unnamed protein product, partial [Urochloa humidicola]